MMNNKQAITNTQLLAIAPDGSPLRLWNEGERTFREIYVYVKAKSGITYGLVNVIELTDGE
jgi:hypothetical protein